MRLHERDASFHDAKRLYLEPTVIPMVTNTYLKIALALCLPRRRGSGAGRSAHHSHVQNFRPLVIRIDDLGPRRSHQLPQLRIQAPGRRSQVFSLPVHQPLLPPQPLHHPGRFLEVLYFLDGKLANGILDAYRKDDIVRKFLTNTSAPEIDMEVKKVALEELQTPPYRARVDFYLVYYSPADHSELKRDLYTANFVFVFKSHVPNELIPINPLGLTITYFREDQAFK